MNRRTALKILIGGIFAPKILIDAVSKASKPLPLTVESAFGPGYIYAPYIPVMRTSLIIDSLVSVQPMPQPSGQIYYIKPEFRGEEHG